MKYKVLLKILHGLIFIKRVFWVTGSQIFGLFSSGILSLWKFFGYFGYKFGILLRGAGLRSESLWFLRRDNLQIVLFISLFIICLPQTKLFGKEDTFIPGQRSLAYQIFGPGEQYKRGFEEVYPETSAVPESQVATWRIGTVGQQYGSSLSNLGNEVSNGSLVVLNNTLLVKPIILPGSVSVGVRKNIVDYKIEEGDSLGGIAYRFGVSVNTLLWENNLTLKSVLKLGQVIKILPVTGLTHTIKKGDTLKKIASTYKADAVEIAEFNGLEEDGSNLKIGEKIIIPNGVKQVVQSSSGYYVSARPSSGITPPSSSQSPSTKGFVWPSAAKYITQYYSWLHHGLDIAGPKNSATYAAKAGTVEVAQCGWNSGYGCYIIINHGGGVKTLYGHHNELLVKPGDYVEAGQTIGLMGNTGKVRGVTGIHLHFEVIVNGARKNPLVYVR
ncbi:MAG TPA: peptidoglycan DD-metalloendopeptidase family protein [Candidatus Magasanikbacteria bacterium]|nr:peptidoglycan DD-metalloendopeptidase family protein [Candidatus Magasanikbacteria bacterium]